MLFPEYLNIRGTNTSINTQNRRASIEQQTAEPRRVCVLVRLISNESVGGWCDVRCISCIDLRVGSLPMSLMLSLRPWKLSLLSTLQCISCLLIWRGWWILYYWMLGASSVRALCTNARAVEPNRVRGCTGLIGLRLLNICGSTRRNSF